MLVTVKPDQEQIFFQQFLENMLHTTQMVQVEIAIFIRQMVASTLVNRSLNIP